VKLAFLLADLGFSCLTDWGGWCCEWGHDSV